VLLLLVLRLPEPSQLVWLVPQQVLSLEPKLKMK
jgi:hypothetical protein